MKSLFIPCCVLFFILFQDIVQRSSSDCSERQRTLQSRLSVPEISSGILILFASDRVPHKGGSKRKLQTLHQWVVESSGFFKNFYSKTAMDTIIRWKYDSIYTRYKFPLEVRSYVFLISCYEKACSLNYLSARSLQMSDSCNNKIRTKMVLSSVC